MCKNQVPTTKNQQQRAGKLVSWQAGFTLLELLISLGIFTVVLIIIVGSFSRFAFLQRLGSAEQNLQEDTRLGLELFDREARTAYGSTYALLDPSNPESGVTFRNQNGSCVLYTRTAEGVLIRNEADSTVADPAADCADIGLYQVQRDQPLTDVSGAAGIASLRFFVVPADVDAEQLTSQGHITISLTAQALAPEQEPLEFQSTVTSRQVIVYQPI